MLQINHDTSLVHQDRLSSLVERIAERSCPQVLERVHGMPGHLTAAEMRGYVRVRAACIVRREIDRILQRPSRVRLADRNHLLGLVIDEVVATLLGSGEDRQSPLAA
jgi:hypothetical protein